MAKSDEEGRLSYANQEIPYRYRRDLYAFLCYVGILVTVQVKFMLSL